MALTTEQKELRKKSIGSSDMAAILGLDPYQNAYDIWLEKTGKLEDKKEDDSSKPYLKVGSAFESGVLDLAEERLGPLRRVDVNGKPICVKSRELPLASNLDAVVIQSNEPVEAKTAGLYGPLVETYGDDGTDELPDRVIVQSHVHLICAEKEICHIPAFIGRRGFVLYHVNWDRELADIIAEKSADFWNNHVLKDIPPEDVAPSLAIVKRVIREPQSIIEVNDDVVAEWLVAKADLNDATKAKKEAEAKLLAALGTAEGGNCSLGSLTYLEIARKGYAVKDSKYRQLRFKKAKEGDSNG